MEKCLVTRLLGEVSDKRLPRLGYLSFNARVVSGKSPIFIVSGNMDIISDKAIEVNSKSTYREEISGTNIKVKLTEDNTFICIKATSPFSIDTYNKEGAIKTENINGLHSAQFVGVNLGNIETLDLPTSCITSGLQAINANFNVNIDDFKVCTLLNTLIVSGNMTGTSSDSIKAIPSTGLVVFVVRGHSSFPMTWTDFSKFTKLFELQVDNISGNHSDLLDALYAAGRTSGEIYLNGSHYTFSTSGWS